MTRADGSGLRFHGAHRGATHLGFSDALVIIIVLGILLWASWEQFPAYDHPRAPIAALEPPSPPPSADMQQKPAPAPGMPSQR